MKQEHLFVANLYHYLLPFIDSARPIYVSLDGEAAKNGVKEQRFQDNNVPDLWFTLVGGSAQVLLEAKVMNADGAIIISQGQLSAWRRNGNGRHPPTAWVASNEPLSDFYYWSHNDFFEKLGNCRARGKYPRIRPPKSMGLFCDIRQLAFTYYALVDLIPKIVVECLGEDAQIEVSHAPGKDEGLRLTLSGARPSRSFARRSRCRSCL